MKENQNNENNNNKIELNETELKKNTVKKLKEYCRDNGIKGYSRKRKQQIIDLIIKNRTIDSIKIDTIKIDKDIDIVKPFLKWVGGKTQIIDKIISKIPIKINNYYELFLGGGSVLLATLSYLKYNKIEINNIFAYDLNESLINLYKNIQMDKDLLYKNIILYMDEYELCDGEKINRKPKNIEEAKTSKESYYYWLRKEYNRMKKEDIKSSALFIILNKLCFRGVYREGPNGFNVPYGHYKKTPTIITKENLDNISNLIKNVKFEYLDFREAFKNINNNINNNMNDNNDSNEYNDFVYLDPPYAPEKNTSFVGYTNNSFKKEDHDELFKLTKELNKKCKFVMSNAKVPFVIESFNKKLYVVDDILCKRAIHCKNPGAKAMEVIISN